MSLDIHHTEKHFQKSLYYFNAICTSRWDSIFLKTIRFI